MQLDPYIRVSDTRGRSGESFISPSVQREQIETWARLRGVALGPAQTDLDETGGVLRRPGLDAILDRIKSGETGGIVVARLDRLSRAGVADALKLVDEIETHGGQLAAVDLGIDPTTMFGEFALTLMLGLARMERRRIAETWTTAQERAVKRGVHIASKPPTGYVRDEGGRLAVANRAHADAVAEAFRLRARGGSWQQVADHLNAQAVPSPYGPTNWHTGSVQHIIKNPAYLGEARSGRHTNAEAHEALIDRATFEAAQAARGATPRSSDPALLAGLIRCASCRYALKPDRMSLRSGDRARIYRCRGRHAGGTCEHRPAALASVIEPHVERLFFEAVGALEAAPTTSIEVEDAASALEVAERDLTAFRDDERIVGVLGQDGYVEGLQVRKAAVDDARARLGDLAGAGGSLPDRATLEATWPDLDVKERNHLLRSAIDAIFMRPGRDLPIEDRVLILFRGEAPDDLPGRGQKPQPIRPFAWPDDVPASGRMAAA